MGLRSSASCNVTQDVNVVSLSSREGDYLTTQSKCSWGAEFEFLVILK